MAVAFSSLIGIGAGLLILGVGAFILAARPASTLHRVFFLLALADGASTLLFQLGDAAPTTEARLLAHGLYWYYYIAFVALLLGFGLVFPRPWGGPRATAAAVVAVALLFAVASTTYALRHDWFWTATFEGGEPRYAAMPAGNVVNAVFVGATGALVLKLTRETLARDSASHRRQAAYVLGGMTLAYAPYAAATLSRMLATRPDVLIAGRPDRLLAYWSFVFLCAGIVASAALLWRSRDAAGARDRRFVLGAYALVAALALVVVFLPTQAFSRLLRTLALLAYPMLLGYAIARYEVFDIDRKLRRAAAVTFAAGGLTVAFVLAENAAEGLLQERLFGGVSSAWVSGSAAAMLTALASAPVVRVSRKAASRLVPELTQDELHARKIEIYRHSLAGALADGILKEGESRTLAALRSSLGITDAEHASLLREVAA